MDMRIRKESSMKPLKPEKEIEKLLQYALDKGLITEHDMIPTRNALMDLLEIKEPYKGAIDKEDLKEDVYDILDKLLDYAFEKGILKENSITCRDLLDTKIMGILTPRAGEVIKKFERLEREQGIEKATADFYAFSKATTYIRMNRILKNLYWTVHTEYGELEITINLSKPEKDPKEIAAAKNAAQENYPKCLLCLENVGYPGRINHPARQNHRVIPLKLSDEAWYFQYSPYVYYNEHCIVFNREHVPMQLTRKTFERMFDFIERFPHYFIGSNADLPIVGGSILSHDHFQGGRYIFPIEKAKVLYGFKHPDYKNVSCEILSWPMSVIRLKAADRKALEELAFFILESWRSYFDKEADIIAFTLEKDKKIAHNTITPILCKRRKGQWELDLVLRNNRTSPQYPDGIFHPHPDVHHIKKENIGLIEVMGLAILPGRLNRELEAIEKILTGEISVHKQMEKKPELVKHKAWIEEMQFKYGTVKEGRNILQKEVGMKFKKVLEDAGVYKQTPEGIKSFVEFLEYMSFEKI